MPDKAVVHSGMALLQLSHVAAGKWGCYCGCCWLRICFNIIIQAAGQLGVQVFPIGAKGIAEAHGIAWVGQDMFAV
jgi:hypothetical protein